MINVSDNAIPQESEQTDWYVTAMEHLVEIVQALSQARDLERIMEIVRAAARQLTGADGATFVLRDGDQCYYAEEDAISPLWKGQRFPMSTCISGWVMLNRQAAVIEDIYLDPRIPVDAYRPTFVKSLAMVPIRPAAPIGAIGNYWAEQHMPEPREVHILQALANVTSVALENVELYTQLQHKVQALEDSNQELSRFAWSAAHDLKSPLRAIDNLSSWIAEDLAAKLPTKSQQDMALLRQRVRRMETLLDTILEYAHLDNPTVPRDDAISEGRTLLEDVLHLVYIPPHFTVTIADGFQGIQVPSLPLQRIFCNLLNNAIKHHDRDTGEIRLGVEDRDSHYRFSVSDDGPGIDPAYHHKIFEMFQTIKPRDVIEGSGMGLTIVKKILTLYGGDISVESQPRQGTAFYFTWPKKLIGLQESRPV